MMPLWDASAVASGHKCKAILMDRANARPCRRSNSNDGRTMRSRYTAIYRKTRAAGILFFNASPAKVTCKSER